MSNNSENIVMLKLISNKCSTWKKAALFSTWIGMSAENSRESLQKRKIKVVKTSKWIDKNNNKNWASARTMDRFFLCVHNVKVQKTSHVVYVSAKRFQYRVEMCVYFSTFYVNPCFCIARKQHKAKIDKCEFDAFTKCGLPIFLSRIRYLSLSLSV